MNCEFACLQKGCECSNCDQRPLSRDYERPPKRKCKALGPEREPQPSIGRMAWSYAKAVVKWTAQGLPVRSEDEVERILTICKACEYFLPNLRCAKCGCGTSGKTALTNKLIMASEHCPLDQPKW